MEKSKLVAEVGIDQPLAFSMPMDDIITEEPEDKSLIDKDRPPVTMDVEPPEDPPSEETPQNKLPDTTPKDTTPKDTTPEDQYKDYSEAALVSETLKKKRPDIFTEEIDKKMEWGSFIDKIDDYISEMVQSSYEYQIEKMGKIGEYVDYVMKGGNPKDLSEIIGDLDENNGRVLYEEIDPRFDEYLAKKRDPNWVRKDGRPGTIYMKSGRVIEANMIVQHNRRVSAFVGAQPYRTVSRRSSRTAEAFPNLIKVTWYQYPAEVSGPQVHAMLLAGNIPNQQELHQKLVASLAVEDEKWEEFLKNRREDGNFYTAGGNFYTAGREIFFRTRGYALLEYPYGKLLRISPWNIVRVDYK